MGVLRRWGCGGYNDGYCQPYSSWDTWGRWVAFAVIVGAAFIIFFLFACFNARRRRTHGLRPHPGTGWMAGPPPSYTANPQQQQPIYADPYYQHPPPPQYSPPNPQMYGYFGGQPQQNGIELQQPQNAYTHGGDRVYQAPPGPPPAPKA